MVCEKPLALTAAESAELVRLAAESGLVNAVNFNIRFYPLNQHLSEAIAGGALGDVRFVTGRYFQDWLLHETDWNWRLEPDKGGALRAVGDIGSHWLDLMTFVTGQPVIAVMADLATFVGERQHADRAGRDRSPPSARARPSPARWRPRTPRRILLRFANGARGALAISQISPGRKNSLQYEIDGSVSAAAWDSETPDHLWIGHRDRPNEILQRNPALMNEAGRRAAALPGGHVEGFGDTFGALFRAIYADVAGRAHGRPTAICHLRRRPRRDARGRRHRPERQARPLGRRGAPSMSQRERAIQRHGGQPIMKLGFLTAPFPETPLP